MQGGMHVHHFCNHSRNGRVKFKEVIMFNK